MAQADNSRMNVNNLADRAVGILLGLTTLAVILGEWAGREALLPAEAVLAAAVVMILAFRVRLSRRVFFVIGLALSLIAVTVLPNWAQEITRALGKAAFIAAFFTALTSLRHAADTSPAVQRCGRFLAQQPPGRRYAALTLGGQLFALLLNYGAIALLGSLAASNARQETDPEIRAHRLRRMLLAIQRGFVSMLPWSPLAFAMAITTSLVPGGTWAGAVLPALMSGIILAGLGWTLDTIFKPRLTGPRPPRATPEGGWSTVLPLLFLLALLGSVVGGLHLLTGVRAIGIVILTVPLIAAGWVMLQAAPGSAPRTLARRSGGYFIRALPNYRGEIMLLMMAGFIGTLGAVLLGPVIRSAGLDLTIFPAWLVLVGLVWLVPITGQFGMNPILSVALIAPILPPASAMGVDPSDIVVAITSGWALSGASSPYTATTLLVGSFGGVSALHVGLRWNGLYTALAALTLSAWVALLALV